MPRSGRPEGWATRRILGRAWRIHLYAALFGRQLLCRGQPVLGLSADCRNTTSAPTVVTLPNDCRSSSCGPSIFQILLTPLPGSGKSKAGPRQRTRHYVCVTVLTV